MIFHEIFEYIDGDLFWKVKPSRAVNIGDRVGATDREGYRVCRYKGKQYKVHRIIWEMYNGAIPEGMMIDHINRVRDDNHVCNLRLADAGLNSRNCEGKGYTWHHGKWQVFVAGKYYGRYEDEELAELVASEAKKMGIDACKL